jgi:hypothetical protein
VIPLLVGLMGLAFVSTAGMFVNAIDSQPWFAGGTARLTTVAIVTYRVLAVAAISFTFAGIVVSISQRWVGFAITNLIVLAFVLLASFVFMVPQYQAPTQHHPLPSNYVPCYSGSNNCPGG